RDQLLETSRLVAERAGLSDWSFAFQSASATDEPWLGPDILEELDRLAANGVRRVLVCAVGFVSGRLEILWGVDIGAREGCAGRRSGRSETFRSPSSRARQSASSAGTALEKRRCSG